MVDGLYDMYGTFQPFLVEDLTTELATRQNAGLFFAEVGGWLTQLPDPDPVLRVRNDDAVILTELTADDQVTTAMLARKYRVLNCSHYSFRAGAPDGTDSTPAARTLHERFVQDMERVNLRSIISGILDAPFYGFTPLELLWRPESGWWHLTDIIPRPYHWFGFDMENRPLFCGAYGRFRAKPKPLTPGKFVFATHHPTYDNPFGLRLLSRCLWPVAFKRGGIQFYTRFTERHGMPWVVAKAPAGGTVNPTDKRVMAADLARMVQDCVAVIPAGSEVQFLTADSAQTDLHERFLARQDRAIAKLIMGQTLTVEMEGRNNSQAAASTHQDVAEGIADADKAMVVDAFNEICWLYARMNADETVETFAPLFAYEEPEDLNARADLDEKLTKMGVKWLRPHFENDYSLKPDEFTLQSEAPEEKEAPEDQPGKPGPEFAAPDSTPDPDLEKAVKSQRRLDAIVTSLLPDALKANTAFVTQLENAVAEAATFDDMQLALADLLSSRMEASELEDLLVRSMTTAAGLGVTAVEEGTSDA